MPSSTATTLNGLQETIVARTNALYRTNSYLFNAVQTQVANMAGVVNFASQAVPQSASALVEGNAVTGKSITYSSVAATLAQYPVLSQVSNLALRNGDQTYITDKISYDLAGAIAKTIDVSITSLFSSSFSATTIGTGSADLTLANFMLAIAKVDESGYFGQKVAVLSPQSWGQIAASLTAYAGTKKEEIDSKGYVGTIFGTEVYVSPWVQKGGATHVWNAVFVKEAIGLAHRDPLFDLIIQDNPTYAAVDFLADCHMSVVKVNSGAGVLLWSKVA